MNLKIRPAEVTDLPHLVQFNQGLAFETEGKQLDPSRLRQGIQTLLDQPHYGFYTVAEMGETTAGCALITYEWSDWRNAPTWWVQSVYVQPEFRRQGIYRQLYLHLREKAITAGAGLMRLYVDRENQRAKATYAALGMAPARYDLFEESL
jgi:GNAT superfamily N-acetyltransferase